MNKTRRKAINKLAEQLRDLNGKFDDIKNEIKSIKDEEQEYFDGLSDNAQNTDKGTASQSAISELENAIDYIGSVGDEIGSAIDTLEGIEEPE